MNTSKFGIYRFLALILAAGLVVSVSTQALGEDDEEDGGTIVFTKPVKAVVFEHANHLAQGLECDSCHDDVFEMEAGAAEAGDDFTMASLYEGRYCGACHDGDTAFASNTRCTVCHIGVKGYNKMMGNVSGEDAHH